MNTQLLSRKRIYCSFNDTSDWINISDDLFGIRRVGVEPWSFDNGALLNYVTTDPTTSSLVRTGIEYSKKYKLKYTLQAVDGVFNGSFKVTLGGTSGTTRTAAGIYTEEITAGTSDNYIKFVGFRSVGGTDPVLLLKDVYIEEIDWTGLDLGENPDIYINLSIADVRDISSKTAGFTRDITLPGTTNNTNFFSFVNYTNIDSSFSLNKGCDTKIIANGNEIFRGFLQLVSTIKVKDSIEYNVNIIESVKNIFVDMGDSTLNELDLSSLNHYLTSAEVMNSYSSTFVSGTDDFVYSFNDYGQGIESIADKTYFALNPQVAYRRFTDVPLAANTGLYLEDLFAGVRIKYLIDKIFTTYGYTYDCTLFDTDEFKRLVFYFGSSVDKLYEWTTVCTAVASGHSTRLSTHPTDLPSFVDPNNTWFPIEGLHSAEPDWYSTPTFCYAESSVSLFPISLYCRPIRFENITYENKTHGAFLQPLNYIPTILSRDDLKVPQAITYTQGWTTYTEYLFSNYMPYSFIAKENGKYRISYQYSTTGVTTSNWSKMSIYKVSNNSAQSRYADTVFIGQYNYVMPSTPQYWSDCLYTNTSEFSLLVSETKTTNVTDSYLVDTLTGLTYLELDLEKGDSIFVSYDHAVGQLPYNVSGTLLVQELTYTYNTLIQGTDLVPDMKQSEFLKGIFDMFNLYTTKDEYDNYTIKTRDEFYLSGVKHIWTDKLDYGADIETYFLSELNINSFSIKYKQHDDYYKKIYLSENNYEYGDLDTVEFDNDFFTDDLTIELPFSIAPISWLYNRNYYRQTCFADANTNAQEYTCNRIIPYSDNIPNGEYDFEIGPHIGFFKQVPWYDYTAFLATTEPKFNVEGNVMLSANGFPVSTHILNPHNITTSAYSQTFDDLSFGGLDTYYFTRLDNQHTSNNIYDVFWKPYITSINHKDSKIVTAYFKLEANDIFTLNLNDSIYVVDTWYWINKIIDYNPLHKICKVELLKLKDTNLISQTYTIIPRGTTTDTVDRVSISQPINIVEKTLNDSVSYGRSPTTTKLLASTQSSVLEGGENEVQDLFGEFSVINIVEGGENCVREYGSLSVNNIIDGGINQ